MKDHLNTTIQSNGKIIFFIVTSDDTYALPLGVRSNIDSCNCDMFWKPGTTHRPMYEDKNIYQLICKRHVFHLKIGKVYFILEREHFQKIHGIWNKPNRRVKSIVPIRTIGSYTTQRTPKSELWKKHRECRIFLITPGNLYKYMLSMNDQPALCLENRHLRLLFTKYGIEAC